MKINQLGSGRAYYEIVGDDGQKYVYVPEEFVQKGFVSGKNQFYDPVFMNKKDEVLSKASSFTLPKGLSVNSTASKLYTDPSKGLIWKAEDFAPYSDKGQYYFSSYNISDKSPAIKSLATVDGKTVYATNASKGYDSTYLNGSSKAGEVEFINNRKSGGGLLGGFLGDLANPVLETVGDALIKAGPALQLANFAVPGLGTGLAAGTALGQGDIKGAALNAGIGELTGNSMVTPGGGTPIWATPSSTTAGNLTPVVDAGTASSGVGTGAGMLSGTDAALADLAASSPAISAPSAATGTGLLGGAATGGVNLGTATAGDLAMAYDPVAANIAAGMSPETAAAAALGTGYGAAAVGGSTLGALGAGAAGTTLGDLATTALIKGGLGLAGGLLQGDTNKDAAATDLAARTALADKAAEMGKFTPVGITTTFGTSNFVTDPKTGAITPSYTLSPTAAGYQKSLSALGNTALSSASNIMNLGNQYINESPEAVRQRYMSTQQSLLAPGQEQQLAGIRTNLANTGRGGLSLGATSDGMFATNPELAAYYNSVAMTNRGIAADAETNYQNQVKFGTGLLGSATTPFTNVFNASTGVETAAQKPLELSTNFANTAASRGAANATNYVNTINPGLSSTYKANTYNPWATVLSGMSDSDLAVWGLKKIIT